MAHNVNSLVTTRTVVRNRTGERIGELLTTPFPRERNLPGDRGSRRVDGVIQERALGVLHGLGRGAGRPANGAWAPFAVATIPSSPSSDDSDTRACLVSTSSGSTGTDVRRRTDRRSTSTGSGPGFALAPLTRNVSQIVARNSGIRSGSESAGTDPVTYEQTINRFHPLPGQPNPLSISIYDDTQSSLTSVSFLTPVHHKGPGRTQSQAHAAQPVADRITPRPEAAADQVATPEPGQPGASGPAQAAAAPWTVWQSVLGSSQYDDPKTQDAALRQGSHGHVWQTDAPPQILHRGAGYLSGGHGSVRTRALLQGTDNGPLRRTPPAVAAQPGTDAQASRAVAEGLLPVDGEVRRREESVLPAVPSFAPGTARIPLGKGGQGEVVQMTAMDGKAYAVKFMFGGDSRMRRETEANRIIPEHPNVVHYRGTTSIDGRTGMVFDLVPGGRSLSSFARTLRHDTADGKVTPQQCMETARRILGQCLDGVEHMARHNVVHHDIKPSNFLVDADGTVKLADFGVSTVVEQGKSRPLAVMTDVGTTAYRAPEMEYGSTLSMDENMTTDELMSKADIYSLGLTFQVVLEGSIRAGKAYDKAIATGRAPVRPYSPTPLHGNPWNILGVTRHYRALGESMRAFSPNATRVQLARQESYNISTKVKLDVAGIQGEAADLVASMIHPRPEMRPTLQEIRNHPFMRNGEALFRGVDS